MAAIASVQAKKRVEAQDKYNRHLEREAIRQYGELDAIESDIIYESHASSLQAQRELLSATSQVELQSAVTGTYGNSIDASIANLESGFGNRMSEITYNRDIELDNVSKQAEDIAAGATAAGDRTIAQPGWYTGLKAGIGAAGAVQGIVGGVQRSRAAARPARTYRVQGG